MFTSLLAGVLTSRLGKYLRGLDEVSVGLWAGQVAVERVQVKCEALDTLNLPFQLVAGVIGRLEVKIPWTRLSSSAVTVTVRDVVLVLRPKEREQWVVSDDAYLEALQRTLEHYELSLKSDFEARRLNSDQQRSQSSYVSQMLKCVIDNLVVNVTNIHLRLEIGPAPKTFPCGIRVESLQICNKPGQEAEECARKSALLTGLSAYCGYVQESIFLPDSDFASNLAKLNSLSSPSPVVLPGISHTVNLEATIVHSQRDGKSLYTIEANIAAYQVKVHPKQVKVLMMLNRLVRDHHQFVAAE